MSNYNPEKDPNVMKLGSESTPYETVNLDAPNSNPDKQPDVKLFGGDSKHRDANSAITGATHSPEKQQGQLGGIGKEETKSASTSSKPETQQKTSDDFKGPDATRDKARVVQGYGSNETEMREDLGS